MTDILGFLRRFFGFGKQPEAKEEENKRVEEKEEIEGRGEEKPEGKVEEIPQREREKA